jgi:hypothetical protein
VYALKSSERYTLSDQEGLLLVAERCTLSEDERNPSQSLRVYALNGKEGFLPAAESVQISAGREGFLLASESV